jgi:pyrroline-5-carboxylate reductase
MGLQTSDRNVTAVKGADAVLLAVKPQVLDDVRADAAFDRIYCLC